MFRCNHITMGSHKHQGLSEHHHCDCLFISLLKLTKKESIKASLVLCVGNPWVIGWFSVQNAGNSESISAPWWHSDVSLHVVHDDVIKWKHFPRYWPFVRGIHRSPVNSPHKGQWRGALMFSLICVGINGGVNNREAGDLRRYRVHYDVIVMMINWCAFGCPGANGLTNRLFYIDFQGECTSMKYRSKFVHFRSRKCIWKCLRKDGHFVSAAMC